MGNDDIIELDGNISPVGDYNTTYNNEPNSNLDQNEINSNSLSNQGLVYELQPSEEPRIEIVNNENNGNTIAINQTDNKISSIENTMSANEKKAFEEAIDNRVKNRRKREKLRLIKTAVLTGVLSVSMTLGITKGLDAKSKPPVEESPHYNSVEELVAANNKSVDMMEEKSDIILDAYVNDVYSKIEDGKDDIQFSEASFYTERFNEYYYNYIAKKSAYDEAVSVIDNPEIIGKSSKIKEMHNKYRNSAYNINSLCYDLSFYSYTFDQSIYKDAITTETNPNTIYIPLNTLIQKGLLDGDYSITSLPEGSVVINGSVYLPESNINKNHEKKI